MREAADPVLDVNNAAAARGAWRRAQRFSPLDLTVNWYAAAAFVCGLASARLVNLIGEIYLGELLLIQFALLLLLLGRMRALVAMPAVGAFTQAAVLLLLGYMLSDIYRDAHPAQFLRGWARIILLTLDFIALTAIVALDRRNLWWFVLAMAIGALWQLMIRGVPIMSPPGWKFGYSMPIGMLLACVSFALPVRVGACVFAALGVWNIVMDYRILGAICVLVAAIVWVRADPKLSKREQARKLAGAALISSSLIAVTLLATNEQFGQRREQSNAGRTSVLWVAGVAIAESPLIGYGSWPMDAKLVQLYEQKMEEAGQLRPNEAGGRVYSPHSQVLQGWIEGGLLGLLFWIYYGYQLARCGLYVALTRPPDAYMPVFLFILVNDFWHLFMSPFSSVTRLPIAIGIAIICACAAEQRKSRAMR